MCVFSKICNSYCAFYHTFKYFFTTVKSHPIQINNKGHMKSSDTLCENGINEKSQISSCSREDVPGVSVATGGQNSRELHVQRGDT